MEEFNKYRLLIVDDEALLRNAMALDFKRKGFTVFSAGTRVEALTLVKSNAIHLVVSDIRMPGGDGISLLEQIHSLAETTPIFIFITGFADASEADCLKMGAKCVVQKPFDRAHLLKTVYDALGIEKAC